VRPHPSYQAWSYKRLLQDYNATVQEESINLYPCAYLHNYEPDDVITSPFYKRYTDQAPVFLKPDAVKLRDFIKRNIKRGDRDKLLYRIDHGKIKPSRNLADSLASMLRGNQEFVMVDDQKIVYETALALAATAATGTKQVRTGLRARHNYASRPVRKAGGDFSTKIAEAGSRTTAMRSMRDLIVEGGNSSDGVY
ncbi:MAG TPA: hypothetical protein PK523_12960, partial [Elusimicrobiales bacterium]|nr:hypothetical protein [Elusimicrobiales bacterium]